MLALSGIFGGSDSVSLGIYEVMKLLPHRYPILLVDRVLELFAGESITAIKNVTINEPFFNGHFPEKPIMPGVLIIEALAQASGILAMKSDTALIDPHNRKLFLFLSIDNAKFRIPVVPGDVLTLKSKITKARSSLCRFECEAIVDGKKVAEAEICAKVINESDL